MAQQKQFDLNLLRVFTTVCRTASFSRAAEELDLTQSSVSNAIARLKRTVGEELFIRVGRGVKPTAAALSLYQQFDEPLSSIEQTLLGLNKFDPQSSQRTFHVYANETMIGLLHRAAEQRLRSTDIKLIFRETPVQEQQLQHELQLENIDLAIDMNKPDLTSFSSQEVMTDKLVCVVRKGHPRISDSISREQYFAEKHIILNLKRGNLSVVDFLTDEVLPTREVYSEQASLLAMLATASKSDAITLASYSYAKEYAELFGLQVLTLPLDVNPIQYHMVWSSKLSRNPANMWLRETLLDLVESRA
ncbi:LysR family transcriptional regulator [Shewanella eurypsychrophilus]|uniref:LysR family transcriptional regulator n=1 Tax=Shewanella eurypsychrophilus TaxID=2593656 RepID=A0ABX6V988_9GAMM|nr:MULTISPECIES: LysR family transcriptional regulator [Shewanella]QFU23702.1 LysR family transcriptional regulator [Shewanella sp. YLB-09]QPG58924.1 LysR family transcriptional regulator [Shewanella eurypsychrophilus]